MWKAKIVSTDMVSGRLRVTVDYINTKDKKQNFQDTHDTTQKQGEDWIDEQIKIRLEHLNELSSLHSRIRKGRIVTSATKPKALTDLPPAAAKWKANYDRLLKWTALNAISITDRKHPAFIKLHRWLRENFKPEYIEHI